jgi:hypothetical protein
MKESRFTLLLFLALAVVLFCHAAFGQAPPLPPVIISTNHLFHAPPRITHIEIITDPDTNAWNVWDYSTNVSGPWMFYTNTPIWQWRIPVSSTNQIMFFRCHSVYVGTNGNL